jgi:hypothetical protein
MSNKIKCLLTGFGEMCVASVKTTLQKKQNQSRKLNLFMQNRLVKNHLKLLEMVSHRQVILQAVKVEGIHAIEESRK